MTERPAVLYSQEVIAQRVIELAERISADYATVEDILLVGVLRGAFVFLADLSRRLTVPCRVDFLAVTRYERGAEPGALRLVMDLRNDIRGQHVLIVEDIVDRGHTLAYLVRTLRARGPASLRTCALTRKAVQVEAPVSVDYVGFDAPDRWLVGYGLDYADKFRTLPYIGTITPRG